MWASLFRSATFRLSLLAVPLYLVAGWALLAFVWFNADSIMDRRVNQALAAERHRLLEDLRGATAAQMVDNLRRRVVAERGSARLYLLADENGLPVAANFAVPFDARPDPGRLADLPVQREHMEQQTRARLMTVAMPHDMTLVLGRDLTEEDQFARVIEETLAIAVALTILLAIPGGILTSRLVKQRLAGMNATARRILHGDLRERMPLSGGGDEFDHLAKNLNEALDRIAELMLATRQVTDNIAHDLRSPLSRIRNRMELALVSHEGVSLEEAVTQSVDDIDTVLDTFEALLAIARLEHGVPPDLEPVDLVHLTEDLVDYFQPLAEEKELTLDLEAGPPVTVAADRHLLFQALSNVVDNAVRYTPEGGHIRVAVSAKDGMGVVTIADDGPGIPAEQRKRVLKRFVRLDTSRHQPGTGLGLAVVEAVARHHHARLTLSDAGPGLVVELALPSSPDSGPSQN